VRGGGVGGQRRSSFIVSVPYAISYLANGITV
jgi:hypothetical protein